jgi:hypothetical protein
MRALVLAAVLAAGCTDRSFTPVPEPAGPRPLPAPRGLTPDLVPSESSLPPRFGTTPDFDDDLPLPPPSCPDHTVAGSGLRRVVCESPPSPRKPADKLRIKWDAGIENRPKYPDTVVLPPWSSRGLSTTSAIITYMDPDDNLRILDGANGSLLDVSGNTGVNTSWFVDDKGETWLYPHAFHPWARRLDAFGFGPFDFTAYTGCNDSTSDRSGLWTADLDRDGTTELVYGGLVVATDLTRLGDSAVGSAGCHPGFVDVDGDGRMELIFGSGVATMTGDTLCAIDRSAVYGHHDGAVHLLDVDADEVPELLVYPGVQRHLPDEGRARLRLQNLHCGLIAEVDASEVLEGGWAFGHIWHIAPFLEVGRPAIVVGLRYVGAGEKVWQFGIILDHELRFRTVVPLTLTGTVAMDHDGDGLYELLGGSHTDFTGPSDHEFATSRSGIFLFNPRTGETTTLRESYVGSRCRFVDADLDGHGELICQSRDIRHEDRLSYMSFEPEGEPWAPAWHFHHDALLPYLYLPDGHYNPLPPSWRHTGMYRAMPSFDLMSGLGSDLVARIVDVCDTECEAGWWTVWAQIGNRGSMHAYDPVRLSLYGVGGDGEVLLGSYTVPRVQAGVWLPTDPLRVPAGDYSALRAVVTGDGWDPDECDKDNNDDVWVLQCP